MSHTVKRLMTLTGSTVGALALFTGSASAHYCYFAAPDRSQGVNGQAWSSSGEMLDSLALLQAAFAAVEGQLEPTQTTCQDAVQGVMDDIAEMPPTTRFMGPGLLAGGAIHHGKDMKKMGHLAFGDVPEDCWMLLEPSGPA